MVLLLTTLLGMGGWLIGKLVEETTRESTVYLLPSEQSVLRTPHKPPESMAPSSAAQPSGPVLLMD